jgi:hypothetical protein
MRFKLSFFLLTLLSFFNAYANGIPQPVVCNNQYALCTSAYCATDPTDKSHVLCVCNVLEGNNVGYRPCEQRSSQQTGDNLVQIFSEYSFAEFETKKFLTCEAGSNWADCLDAFCIINENPHQANCQCTMKSNEAFITMGGNCDHKSCQSKLMSGVKETLGKEMQMILAQVNDDSHEYRETEAPYCKL